MSDPAQVGIERMPQALPAAVRSFVRGKYMLFLWAMYPFACLGVYLALMQNGVIAEQRLARGAQTISGTLKRIEADIFSPDDGPDEIVGYYYFFRFEFGGRSIEGRSYHTASQFVGSALPRPVTIEYDPKQPTFARVQGTRANEYSVAWIVILLIAAQCVWLLLILMQRQSAQAQIAALASAAREPRPESVEPVTWWMRVGVLLGGAFVAMLPCTIVFAMLMIGLTDPRAPKLDPSSGFVSTTHYTIFVRFGAAASVLTMLAAAWDLRFLIAGWLRYVFVGVETPELRLRAAHETKLYRSELEFIDRLCSEAPLLDVAVRGALVLACLASLPLLLCGLGNIW